MTKIKNNFWVKLMVALAFALSAICLAGCLQSDKNITKISVITSTVPAEIEVGKFNQAGIKIKVEYEDGSSAEMPVTLDMVDDKHKQILNTQTGSYTITIKFRGVETKIEVNIVEATTVHTVKFYNADGYMIYRDDNVKHGEASTTPSKNLLNYNGYIFVEWDRAVDNVTEDMNVYGIYYRVDNSLTDEVMEQKVVELYNNRKVTSHTASTEMVSYDLTNKNAILEQQTAQQNYHYVSANEYRSQVVYNVFDSEGSTSDLYDVEVKNGKISKYMYYQNQDTLTREFTNFEQTDYNSYASLEPDEYIWQLITNPAYGQCFNLPYYMDNFNTKTYTYHKYTNGKNIYTVTFSFVGNSEYDQDKNVVNEITFNDTQILSMKETLTDETTKMVYTYYFDNTETDFIATNNDGHTAENCISTAKSFVANLKTATHHLVLLDESKQETSETYTYDSATKSYKNADGSKVLPIIANFEQNVDNAVTIYNQVDGEKLLHINFTLNGKLYGNIESVDFIYDANGLVKIEYTDVDGNTTLFKVVFED